MSWKILKKLMVVFLIFFVSGCGDDDDGDDFYSSTSSTWDSSRIPLIRPYEMNIEDNRCDMIVSFDYNTGGTICVSNIIKFNVEKPYVLLEANDRFKGHGYFIFNTTSEELQTFESEDQFLEKCNELKLTKGSKLLPWGNHLSDFSSTGKCHWFETEDESKNNEQE